MATATEGGTTDEALEIFCDPCQIDDKHVAAVSYCEECNEYICKLCQEVHRRLAATRNHIVKALDELRDNRVLKKNVTNLPEKCLAHPKQVLAYYCVSHDELCCSPCLSSSHKTCKDVKNITDYFKEFDVEQEESKLKNKIRTLSDEVSKTMYMVQNSIKAAEHFHDQAESEMTEAKRNAVEHIEKIYSTLADESKKIRDKDLNTIVPYKHKCRSVSFDMRTLESYFSNKRSCNKTHLAFAIKNADEKIDSDRRDLLEIRCNRNLNITKYNFKPDVGIVNMKTKPSSFGSMEIQNNDIKTAAKFKSFQIKDADDDENCNITGLALLSETCLVLADQNNTKIKLIDTEEDKVISNLKFESQPWDVTCVANNKVAVTFPEKNIVELLSVGNNSIFERTTKSNITCTGKCYGITSSKDTVIVTVIQNNSKTKIERYNLDGSLLISVGVDIKKPQYIIFNNDATKIYVSSNTRGERIVELSIDDFTILTKLISCRDEVTGMTIDKTGVMYYCDSYYHEIDMVDLNKKQIKDKKRQLLISDKTPNPMCLAFCNETNRLFVGKNGNEICVYIIL